MITKVAARAVALDFTSNDSNLAYPLFVDMTYRCSTISVTSVIIGLSSGTHSTCLGPSMIVQFFLNDPQPILEQASIVSKTS